MSLHMAYLLLEYCWPPSPTHIRIHLLTAAPAKNTSLPLRTSHYPFGSSITGLLKVLILSKHMPRSFHPLDYKLPGNQGQGLVHLGMPSTSWQQVQCLLLTSSGGRNREFHGGGARAIREEKSFLHHEYHTQGLTTRPGWPRPLLFVGHKGMATAFV